MGLWFGEEDHGGLRLRHEGSQSLQAAGDESGIRLRKVDCAVEDQCGQRVALDQV